VALISDFYYILAKSAKYYLFGTSWVGLLYKYMYASKAILLATGLVSMSLVACAKKIIVVGTPSQLR